MREKWKTINFLEYVIIFIYIILIVIGFAQVFFRYVLQNSIFWSEEFLTYIFIWLVFLGAALAVRNRTHPAVDLLITRFNKKNRLKFAILGDICIIAYAGIAIVKGFELVNKSMSFSSALLLPYKYVYLSLPVGSILIAFFTILNLKEDIENIRKQTKEISKC
jgi:TRAP-type C4-dicarboxylate transport system permease small subunit